jgi:hypothetical protein
MRHVESVLEPMVGHLQQSGASSAVPDLELGDVNSQRAERVIDAIVAWEGFARVEAVRGPT